MLFVSPPFSTLDSLLVLYFERSRSFIARFISKYSFCRFLISGGITTACDYVIYMAVSMVVPVPIAKALSMGVACLLSYTINKSWSFKVNETSNRQVGRFVVSQVANITCNTSVNSLAYFTFNNKTLAFVIATGVAMMLNFTLQRFWVFRKKGEC